MDTFSFRTPVGEALEEWIFLHSLCNKQYTAPHCTLFLLYLFFLLVPKLDKVKGFYDTLATAKKTNQYWDTIKTNVLQLIYFTLKCNSHYQCLI